MHDVWRRILIEPNTCMCIWEWCINHRIYTYEGGSHIFETMSTALVTLCTHYRTFTFLCFCVNLCSILIYLHVFTVTSIVCTFQFWRDAQTSEGWCPLPSGGGETVKTLGVGSETVQWTAEVTRMELWGGAEVAWMWCCAAPLVVGLLAASFSFFLFSFFPLLGFPAVVEMERLQERVLKKETLECWK